MDIVRDVNWKAKMNLIIYLCTTSVLFNVSTHNNILNTELISMSVV